MNLWARQHPKSPHKSMQIHSFKINKLLLFLDCLAISLIFLSLNSKKFCKTFPSDNIIRVSQSAIEQISHHLKSVRKKSIHQKIFNYTIRARNSPKWVLITKEFQFTPSFGLKLQKLQNSKIFQFELFLISESNWNSSLLLLIVLGICRRRRGRVKLNLN